MSGCRYPLIVGESPPIRRLRELIARVAPSNLAVLIQGPTGSGKELVAHAVHAGSGRAGAFVPFNVCAIPDSMLEDALFGHVRGAFTGATRDVPGYLAEADRGTVFLDEIGAMAVALQAKLLRALETLEFRPVGAKGDRRSAFRVVSATNERLGFLVESGRFRADLAHRLGAITLTVPALKERLEDVPFLAQHFLHDVASRSGLGPEISAAGINALLDYDWPGNVRELRQVIEAAVILSDAPVLGAEQVRTVLAQHKAVDGSAVDGAFARRRLVALLQQVGWDTAAAARVLGVHRVTVYRRMRRFGIPRTRAGVRDVFASNCANLQAFAANEAGAIPGREL